MAGGWRGEDGCDVEGGGGGSLTIDESAATSYDHNKPTQYGGATK